MEAKKNPGKDIHKMTGMFFQIGLGISIAIVITAFEWTTKIKKPALRQVEETNIDLVYIPVTNPTEPIPPSPIAPNTITVSKTPMLTTELTTTSEESVEESQPYIEISELTISSIPIEVEPAENYNEVISFPEKKAEPVGGYSSFYKLMHEKMKYPTAARKFNVEGRVFVEFVVNRDGSVVDLKVIKGIGAGCDEEAVRVIGLSKWYPGQQRGNPVRVRMVLPVIFKLQ